MRYSNELKNHVLKRVLPPREDPIERVAFEEGISEQTVRNWKRQALDENFVPPEEEELEVEKWSSQDKFLIVVETQGMSEADLGEYARKKGLFVEQISEWRDACLNANGGVARMASRLNRELKEKERELRLVRHELDRKEKALAEAATLLVYAKKASAILNAGEDA